MNTDSKRLGLILLFAPFFSLDKLFNNTAAHWYFDVVLTRKDRRCQVQLWIW